MSGRRNTGNAAGLVGNMIVKDRERQLNNQDRDAQDRREFDQRMQAAGITAGIASGQITPSFEGGQFRGFQQAPQPQLGAQDLMSGDLPDDVKVTQTIKTPRGTITITRGGNKPKEPKFLPEGQAGDILGQAQPGQPLPQTRMGGSLDQPRTINNVPMGAAGTNTMNAAIRSGMTESPSALSLGNRLAPHTVPQGRFLPGPAGRGGFIGSGQMEVLPGYEGATVSRQEMIGQLRGQQPAMQPQMPMSAPQDGAGSLRQAAMQELQAAGAPLTEANIQEAMRQLHGG